MATSMPEAACQNGDCGHEWSITKPPQDYARGWPSCPECGSTRVTVNGQTKEDVETQASAPARVEEEQQAQSPATEEQAAQFQSGGEQIAATLAPAVDKHADPEDRADGIMNAAQLGGGLISGIMKYNERKRQVEEQRAQSANLEPVDDKPSCENCGYTFSRIPAGAERVQCEGCGREYRVS